MRQTFAIAKRLRLLLDSAKERANVGMNGAFTAITMMESRLKVLLQGLTRQMR